MSPQKRKSQAILGKELSRCQTILEATKTLNSTLDLATLTEIILQVVREKVPVDRVTAFMVDRKSGTLRSVVAQDVGDYVIRLPIGVGIAGYVAQTGEAVDVADAYNDPRFYPAIDQHVGYRTRDVFCLPIRNRDEEIVGVLELLNRTRDIGNADIEFLKQISVHIGLALDLAWSHREVLDKQNREEELKLIRERLAAVDRAEVVGELVASVMHELNNPLAILVGNVDLLKIQLEKSEAKSETMARYVENIEAATDRSVGTIRKYRHMTDVPPRERQPVDLAEIFRQTTGLREFVWARNGIDVTDDLHSVPAIMANKEEMQYVFLTLLKHAEDAVLESGKHIILRCSYESAADCIRVDIANNGPGISDEAQGRIFDPIFTLQQPNTMPSGLSLNIARRIIESHAGKIWLRSKEGSGTTVSFELPVKSKAR